MIFFPLYNYKNCQLYLLLTALLHKKLLQI